MNFAKMFVTPEYNTIQYNTIQYNTIIILNFLNNIYLAFLIRLRNTRIFLFLLNIFFNNRDDNKRYDYNLFCSFS